MVDVGEGVALDEDEDEGNIVGVIVEEGVGLLVVAAVTVLFVVSPVLPVKDDVGEQSALKSSPMHWQVTSSLVCSSTN